MPTVNLGRVKPIHRGTYNGATTYQPLDYVNYNGIEYHCIVTSTGNLPTDTGFFSPVVDVTSVTTALDSKANLSGADFTGPVTLSTAKIITDWNVITASGFYMAANAANAPAASVWFIGYCIVHNTDWVSQEVWRFSDNNESDNLRYRREKNSGSWGAWYRVYSTESEINSAATAKADLSGATFTGDVNIGASPSPFKLTVANNNFDGGWIYSSGTDSVFGLGGYFSPTGGTFQIKHARSTGATVFSTGPRDAPNECVSIDSSGNISFEKNLAVGTQAGTGEAAIEIGNNRTGSGVSYIDLVSVAGADYNGRILRGPAVDDNLNIENTGTGLIAFIGNFVPRLVIQQADGAVLANNSVGIGYGAGSGGSVTQPTSKATTVMINKPSGRITMNNAALSAGAAVAFAVLNSAVSAQDTVSLNVGNAVGGNYRVDVQEVVNGQFNVRITNITGGSLSEALELQFNIIKGSTT